MADSAFHVKIEGAERLQEALKDPKLLKGPIADFLKKSGAYVELAAKERAPVDTGHMKSTIAFKVKETEVEIGTNVFYAPYVEFGTRPHFPPSSALEGWARKHGFGPGGGFLVARAISRRGTKKQPFLVPALQGAKSAIDGFLKEAINKIEAFWERK